MNIFKVLEVNKVYFVKLVSKIIMTTIVRSYPSIKLPL